MLSYQYVLFLEGLSIAGFRQFWEVSQFEFFTTTCPAGCGMDT